MQSKLFSRKASAYITAEAVNELHGEDIKRSKKGRTYSPWHRFGLPISLIAVLLSSVLVLYKRKGQLRTIKNGSIPIPPQLQNFTSDTPMDFIVAAFPKCGTTSLLLTVLHPHPEINIGSEESCQIARPRQADDINIKQLDREVGILSQQNPKKLVGMKCPEALKNMRAIHRLSLHSPTCRFVIGMRHPVLLFQSYYNYRVTCVYNEGKQASEYIPSLEEVVASPIPWKEVSLDVVRFELFLVQLAKTDISLELLQDLKGRDWIGIKPNRFPVFVYTTDQLEDIDAERQESFRRRLGDFLGLSEPLASIGRKNINKFVGHQAHSETIDICQSRYDGVRQLILRNAKVTQAYIRKFIRSTDVTVANSEHFLASIQSWERDPCNNFTLT